MLLFKARPRKDPSLSSELTPSQRRMMRTLRDARQEVQAQLRNKRGEMMRLLTHASTPRIMDAVPTNPWYTAQQELQANLQAELISAGRRVQLPAIQKASVKFKFDDERREAAAWAYKEAARLVQDVTMLQRATITSLVARAELGEFTPDEVARLLRKMEDGIGLTDQQAEWVENYRERYIADQMSQGRTLSDAQERAEKPTNRYADRIYRYRTETIARTEIMRASNEGRNQAWQQGIEGGWINPDALKVWSVEVDGRECSTCRPLGDLDPIPINDSFPQGDPPVHPNCRCTVRLTDEIPQDLMDMTDDELEAEIDRLLAQPEREAEAVVAPTTAEQRDESPVVTVQRAMATGEAVSTPADRRVRDQLLELARDYGPAVNLAVAEDRRTGPESELVLRRRFEDLAREIIEGEGLEDDFLNDEGRYQGWVEYRAALLERAKMDLAHRMMEARYNPQQLEQTREYAQRVIDTGLPMVAVPNDAVREILVDGRFRSQFETDDSRGSLDPELRAETEAAMLGVHPEVDPTKRPIYGYVATTSSTPEGVSQYGHIRFALEPEVKERSTFTLGDSLGLVPRPISLAADTRVSADDALQARGVTIFDQLGVEGEDADTRAVNFERRNYAEMQIKEGLSVDEIRMAYVPTGPAFDATARNLERRGIAVERYEL